MSETHFCLELLHRYHERLSLKPDLLRALDQRPVYERMIQFAKSSDQVFLRSHLTGHFTGSALIIDFERTHVLMTHHKKLKKWLQLGGHADGSGKLEQVALREGQEESGIADLKFIDWWQGSASSNEKLIYPIPFDLDIHEIPHNQREPAHLHYDVGFLFEADRKLELLISDESNDLRWIPIKDINMYTHEISMLRQISKAAQILN